MFFFSIILPESPNRLFREADGILDDRQGAETEEVHLEKAEALDGCHGELRRRGAVLCAGKRDEVLRRARTDDDAGCMHGSMAGQALQAAGHINQLLHAVIRLVGFAHVRIHLQRFIESDTQLIWNHACDRIAETVGKVHDAADVTDNALRLQRAESDDLHHPVRTIFLRHIIDDLLSPFESEVDVDIRHGDTFRIEKALENKIILDGVQIRNMKAV